MAIKSLFVKNLRNISQARITLCAGFNLLVGENGAGKTSVLESIDVLSRGCSFRSRRKSDLIRFNEKSLLVGAKVERGDRTIALGVRKGLDENSTITIDDESVSSAVAAATLPVRIFHPESHELVCGPSASRRHFLDWGVFHVKLEFFKLWADYQKCLNQRNALLKQRSAAEQAAQWDQTMSELADQLDACRSGYFHSLRTVIRDYLATLRMDSDLTVEYKRGWSEENSLADTLRENWPADFERGTTQVGPHRADISLEWGGVSARQVVSRGQQKLIALVLLLSQVRHFVRTLDKECVILIDDLASELDDHHREWMLKELKQLGQQLVVTGTHDGLDLLGWPEMKKFHVKRGTVEEREIRLPPATETAAPTGA